MPAPASGSRVRTVVLAIATAVAVSTIYIPQPLLTQLSHALRTSTGGAGLIATSVQLGYAVGIFLLVPLADRLQPRRQITVQLLLLTAALVITAVLPNAGAVAIGFFAVGLVANLPQLIIPVAARLAPDSAKQATTGTLVGALLVGIFGGRILAGAVGEALGWRAVVLLFAAIVLATVPLVRRALPPELEVPQRKSYGELLLGVARLTVRSRPLLQSAIMQFCGFAAFNAIWTVMVLHLTGPGYGWSVVGASLFGFLGLAAGLVTPIAGGWMQRFGYRRVSGIFLVLAAAAMASIVIDARAVWLFGVSVFLLTWANQVLQAGNQSRAMTTNPGAGAQANTVFMVAVFLGGSAGGALGPAVFGMAGMSGVAVLGLVLFAGFALTWAWATTWERRRTPAALRAS